MADIPNTQYITVRHKKEAESRAINSQGVSMGGDDKTATFVGGAMVYSYEGIVICDWDKIESDFGWLRRLYPYVEEFHIGTFAEIAEIGEVRSLSGTYGPNLWCRLKLKDKDVSSNWVACDDYGFYWSGFVRHCLNLFRCNESFRSALLVNAGNKKSSPIVASEKDLKQVLKNTDLSKFMGKSIELNGYEITIKKIATDGTQKQK